MSFDGSWMTRGHKSAYGIGCVIDTVTGLCVDLAVFSLYCQRCSYARRRFGGRETQDFKDWFETHSNECNRNFDGTSGGMEAAAAEMLWERSVERHGFRYTTIVSDGDAKTFKHLCDRRVYGDVELKKEECINHVAKRLGTALRKLASSGKKAGVVLGGRGHGRLTQATIMKLTAYYGKAVRAHPNDLDAMRDAVWATFYHATSTDEKPQHDRCPVGADSWCFYQKALATGQTPGPHRTNVGTPLSVDVAKPVKEVYERLSHDDLLTRCLCGQTQNPNESLHSKVWAKCPKTGFVCVHRVLSATCAAVADVGRQRRSGGYHATHVRGDGNHTWGPAVGIGRENRCKAASTSRATNASFDKGSTTCSASCSGSRGPVNCGLCCWQLLETDNAAGCRRTL